MENEFIGQCKKCNSENITYEYPVNDGNTLIYKYVCDDCKHEGSEIYNISFYDYN